MKDLNALFESTFAYRFTLITSAYEIQLQHVSRCVGIPFHQSDIKAIFKGKNGDFCTIYHIHRTTRADEFWRFSTPLEKDCWSCEDLKHDQVRSNKIIERNKAEELQCIVH